MFSYLGVLISIILGLAITHLVVGLSKLIQLRHTVKPYWVQILWTLNILIYVLGIWWTMFWWNRLPIWTVGLFFFIATYAIVLFLLATMLFPWEFSKDLDFRKYFLANRSWFFGTQLVAFLIDIPETILKQTSHIRPVPREYVVFIAVILAINVIGLTSRNERVHAALAVGWFVAVTSYLSLTMLYRLIG